MDKKIHDVNRIIIPKVIEELIPNISTRIIAGEHFCFHVSFDEDPIPFESALEKVLANKESSGFIKLRDKTLKYSNGMLITPLSNESNLYVKIVACAHDNEEILYNFKIG